MSGQTSPRKRRRVAPRHPATHPQGLRHQKRDVPWPAAPDADACARTIWVDENGLGCLADGFVVTAVWLRDPAGLYCHDSKLLRPREREVLFRDLQRDARLVWAQYLCPAHELDQVGVWCAWQLAVAEAVRRCRARLAPAAAAAVTRVVVDGNRAAEVDELEVATQVGGDRRCLGIAVASLLGKEVRDARVAAWAERFPAFRECLRSGKGYGTRAHRALVTAGHFTPYHRRSYAPLRGLRDLQGIDDAAPLLVLHVAAATAGCWACGQDVPALEAVPTGPDATAAVCAACAACVADARVLQLPDGKRVLLE